jgi:hypothetical protein
MDRLSGNRPRLLTRSTDEVGDTRGPAADEQTARGLRVEEQIASGEGHVVVKLHRVKSPA